MTAKATRMTLTYFGRQDVLAGGRLKGLAELVPGGAERYGYAGGQEGPEVATEVGGASALWRHVREVRDPEAFWEAVKPCFGQDVWDELAAQEQRRAAMHG